MKKLMVVLSVFLLSTLVVKASDAKDGLEDGVWVLKGITGVNLSQTTLNNWSAGGENAVAGNVYLNGSLKRKTGNWLWINTLALEYGLSKMESQGNRKTSDNIDFSTQLGYSINNKWFYTGMGSFKSQFYKGYKYPDKTNYISKFMAPAYSTLSLGIEYRPNNNYSFYYSPASSKLTFVQDDYLSSIGAFGVDPGDKFKAEVGTYFKARAEQKLMENVHMISTLDLFSAYDSSFGNVDVNWDILISMKINKYLTASLNTTFKYDDDIRSAPDKGPRLQIKEILGVGLAYSF